MNPRWMLCSADDGAPDSGGGGGSTPAPSAAPAAAPTPAPQSAPASTPNPAPPANFRYNTDAAPTAEHTTQVRGILDKESDPNHKIDMDEIRSLLGFNPPFKTNVQAAAEADPNAPDPNAPPAAATPATPAVAEPPKLDPNVQALVDSLSALTAPVAAPTAPTAPAKPVLYYGGTVAPIEASPQLSNAIFNAETPEQAHQALNVLLNGVMNRIMDDTGARMLQVAKTLMTSMPRVAAQQYDAQTANAKFFEKFKELNKPAFQPAIAAIATALKNERARVGKTGVDDEYIDGLGNAVHAFLEEQMGHSFRPQTVAPAPKPGTTPAPKPAAPAANGNKFFTPGGARQEAALPNGKDDNDWRKLVT